MRSDSRAFWVFGCRHIDLCGAAGWKSVNNLIRQSPLDGKRVLKDMCRRRGNVLLMRQAKMKLWQLLATFKVRLLSDLCSSATTWL